MQQPSLPDSLSRLTKDFIWQQITIGCSDASTYLLRGSGCNQYLKIQSLAAVERLWQEKVRIEWLQGRLPVPEVLQYEKDKTHEYLLISEIAGIDASHRSFESRVPRLMRQLALGLRKIHEVNMSGCPFDERLGPKIPEAARRVEHGLVDEEDFDESRQGRTANELLEQLIQTKPSTEDLVFTHGDYCLPNIILNDDSVSGFIDWGRAGIADRYQDLALAIRSITYNFGAGHIGHFLESYGVTQLDESKVAYYQLMDEFF